ncbi:hypothetical protein WJX82_000823 [Trebouxia sp. C0006]
MLTRDTKRQAYYYIRSYCLYEVPVQQKRSIHQGCAYVANSPFLRRRCRTVLRHARKGILNSERRVTNGLIAVHAALFAAQFASNRAVTQWGAKYAPAIAAGQWWRLISCNFLHLSWWRLGMNMLAVSDLGAACERDYGAKRMAVYSTACLASSVASYLFNPAISLGASGGLFGLWAMNPSGQMRSLGGASRRIAGDVPVGP